MILGKVVGLDFNYGDMRIRVWFYEDLRIRVVWCGILFV